MKSYQTVKKRLLRDRIVRKAYEDLGVEFALTRVMLEKRMEQGLTQTALAKRVGTKQSAIARLESGASNPTIGFLERVAQALDAQLTISLSGKRS